MPKVAESEDLTDRQDQGQSQKNPAYYAVMVKERSSADWIAHQTARTSGRGGKSPIEAGEGRQPYAHPGRPYKSK